MGKSQASAKRLIPKSPVLLSQSDRRDIGDGAVQVFYRTPDGTTKERLLVMRADAHRILIVAPGSLVEQWRDELYEKVGLEFRIYSSDLKLPRC